jgi:polyisoprenoid-binding protein YceI
MLRIGLVLLLLVANPALGQRRVYQVDAQRSLVTIAVDRSGVFGFAGHRHEISAPALSGEVTVDPGDLLRASCTLVIEAAQLKVTGRGEPPQDVPKVQANMIGPKVLDVARFPVITFRAVSVTGLVSGAGPWDLVVSGDLDLHGVTRRLSLPLRVEMDRDSLAATGTTVLRQSDYGIKPLSVAGVVKVRNEVTVACRIVARAR